jgi:hypothetical protein
VGAPRTHLHGAIRVVRPPVVHRHHRHHHHRHGHGSHAGRCGGGHGCR